LGRGGRGPGEEEGVNAKERRGPEWRGSLSWKSTGRKGLTTKAGLAQKQLRVPRQKRLYPGLAMEMGAAEKEEPSVSSRASKRGLEE
jgi:hypothetical protein